MVSFPKLLYPLQTIPYLLKHKDVSRLNKAFTRFIWKGGRSRISLQKVCRPVKEGGFEIPDIRKYNLASLLRYAIDWLTDVSIYSNTALEQAGAHSWKLEALLHSKISSLPAHLNGNILYRDTIRHTAIARLLLCTNHLTLAELVFSAETCV